MSLIQGDARAIPLRDGCVQTVVTSPPYWGLRDYQCAGQLGLEPTPALYVGAILRVFAEVWRVLRDDGTVWLNLGDSYAASGCGGDTGRSGLQGSITAQDASKHAGQRRGVHSSFRRDRLPRQDAPHKGAPGLKAKDLVGLPWTVALALRDVGWYLRSDVIWHKPNPMPESVTDRPTNAHEYLFLLAKRERYYYDQAAIFEPYAESTLREVADGYDGLGLKDYAAAGVQNPSDVKRRIIEGMRRKNDTHVDHRKAGVNEWDKRGRLDRESHHGRVGAFTGRNKRSVWAIPTEAYPGAHYATFPEALVEPCILAGAPLGGLVFDPFVGTGTVGAVAERLSRRWVGLDLAYHDLSTARTAQRGLTFAELQP